MDTCWMRVSEAADACSGVGNAGELHGALRDRKRKGKAVRFWGKVWLKYSEVLRVDTWYYIVRYASGLGTRVRSGNAKESGTTVK